ncbi:MAG: hypothetical protein JWN78_320 [Bacteroidota bacterium]|nr:hypothetical protein [Bacteroidota bacterium]
MEIIQQLKKHRRLELTLLLMASCFLSFGLIVLRVMVSHQLHFIFLIWNLFLAFIPFYIANWLYLFKERFNRITVIPFLFLWLLFLPNAPYIITDIVHLHPGQEMNYWYSLLIVVSCAWNALVMGLLSLNDVQNVVSEKYGKTIAWIWIVLSVFLAAFGIYIGRILRWNSWDLFFDTRNVMYDIGERVSNPAAHGRTCVITLFYGMFLMIVYLFFRHLLIRREVE